MPGRRAWRRGAKDDGGARPALQPEHRQRVAGIRPQARERQLQETPSEPCARPGGEDLAEARARARQTSTRRPRSRADEARRGEEAVRGAVTSAARDALDACVGGRTEERARGRRGGRARDGGPGAPWRDDDHDHAAGRRPRHRGDRTPRRAPSRCLGRRQRGGVANGARQARRGELAEVAEMWMLPAHSDCAAPRPEKQNPPEPIGSGGSGSGGV